MMKRRNQRIPAKHFNDMTAEEQQAILSRIHPSLLTSGMWVSPGEPTQEELDFFCNLPGADSFRRHMAELAVKLNEEQS